METYIDPVAYRVDPNFDLEAHQKRYRWRGLDTPRVTETEVEEQQPTNGSARLREAA